MASIAVPASHPGGARRQWWRQQLVAAGVLLVILTLLAPIYRDLVDHHAPRARAGVLTLAAGTALARPIGLAGDWRARRLDGDGSPFVLPVPSPWSGLADAAGHPLPSHGVVRYELTLRGLAPGTYSLYIPVLYEATRVWVDGRLMGGVGDFGLDARSTRYRVGASEITFVAAGRDVELAIDIAAFHHRDTGIDEAPVLGSTRTMSGWSALQWLRDGLFITALMLVSLFGLVIYFYRRNDRAFLLLGLAFGTLLPVPLIYGHDNLLSLVAPSLPFATVLAMQYISVASALLFLTAYVAELFPAERVRWVDRTLIASQFVLGATQLGLALAGATVAMSYLSQASEPIRLTAFVYLITVAARAVWRRRTGAIVFLFGITVLLVTVGLRTLTTSALLPNGVAANVNLTALGILAFLFSQVIIMAERWTEALRTAERMTAEVVAERNYSNSILGSMSSGVITIEADTRVTKLNTAARRIMRVGDDQPDDAAALAVLRANPWLLPELQQVRTSGEAKSMVDADARTSDGQDVSINLTIVPLTFEDARTGLLAIVDDISHGKRLQGTMRRFMSQEVVEQVLANEEGLLFGQACEASILFADIRGFTTMSEHLSPRDTVDMLNGIFTELFEAVANAGGMLDKFIGDAVMAVFGAPIPTGRDPAAAIGSARLMFDAIAMLNRTRADRGVAPLRLGIGIASGEVVAGTIGSPKRMEYTVIGDAVNLAARLQDLTKSYGVDLIVDETTARAAADEATLRPLDLIRVRGRETPVRIFGLRASEVEANPEALWQAYAKGRALLDAGRVVCGGSDVRAGAGDRCGRCAVRVDARSRRAPGRRATAGLGRRVERRGLTVQRLTSTSNCSAVSGARNWQPATNSSAHITSAAIGGRPGSVSQIVLPFTIAE